MLAAATGPLAVAGPGAALARPGLDEWQKLFEYAEQSLGKIVDQIREMPEKARIADWNSREF